MHTDTEYNYLNNQHEKLNEMYQDRCQDLEYQFNRANILEEKNKIYKKALQSIQNIIESSNGVDGLHLNGDLFAWEDLSFEGWLDDFNLAIEDIKNDS